jgi:hypothetical protein
MVRGDSPGDLPALFLLSTSVAEEPLYSFLALPLLMLLAIGFSIPSISAQRPADH